jgi:Spy/CpxP family protein refolding chaperone
MKKLFLLGVVLAFTLATAIAQPSGRKPVPAEQRVENRLNRLQKELDLNNAQTKALYADLLRIEQARDAAREQQMSGKGKNRELTLEADSLIKKQLTDEQLKKYEALKAERKANVRQQRQENRQQAPRQVE